MVFHMVFDHDYAVEELDRINGVVSRSGRAFRETGSLKRKKGYLKFRRVIDR